MRTEEFTHVLMSDVKKYPDIFHVKIEITKTKVKRSFTISQPFYDIVAKYIAKRPAKVLTSGFFIRYSNGKCHDQVIGKNKFSGMPRAIAEYLGLEEPERYTGTYSLIQHEEKE